MMPGPSRLAIGVPERWDSTGPVPHAVFVLRTPKRCEAARSCSVVGDVDLTEETDEQWISLGLLSYSARQQYADRGTHGEHEERDTIEECDRAVSQAGLSRSPGE